MHVPWTPVIAHATWCSKGTTNGDCDAAHFAAPCRRFSLLDGAFAGQIFSDHTFSSFATCLGFSEPTTSSGCVWIDPPDGSCPGAPLLVHDWNHVHPVHGSPDFDWIRLRAAHSLHDPCQHDVRTESVLMQHLLAGAAPLSEARRTTPPMRCAGCRFGVASVSLRLGLRRRFCPFGIALSAPSVNAGLTDASFLVASSNALESLRQSLRCHFGLASVSLR